MRRTWRLLEVCGPCFKNRCARLFCLILCSVVSGQCLTYFTGSDIEAQKNSTWVLLSYSSTKVRIFFLAGDWKGFSGEVALN